MKRYKGKEVIDILKADGWYFERCNGDHRHFNHPVKKGTVTVSGKLNDTVSQELLNSIWKQAGWR
jgi:predicted RNA binding protein YcfA (HicA-like mRNA interferase family)